jgi:ribonucleoside-diphosphate reductase alpha chain
MSGESIIEHVLRERYYQPGESSLNDVFDRVTTAIYPQDRTMRTKFHEMMSDMRFLPNSPTLMNSGTEIGQLSACFSLGINDDMVSIFDTLKNAALIFKSGRGVGINFSYLRPKGASVGSTLGTSSGVLSFMQVYNSMVETVKSGAVRRGAAIGILNIDHPEIEDFIVSKNIEGQLSNFNISVMITDEFMKAVELGDPWYLKFEGKVYKEVDARELFNKIAKSMWTRAEPGILYYDAINKDNVLIDIYGPIDTCNPCGEKMLVVLRKALDAWLKKYEGGGSSCNLGSLNLIKYVKDGQFNFKKFETDVRLGVRILDQIIDVNKYPLEQIEYITKDIRELGLGVMGYHDMLIEMGIPYDSEDAYQFEEKLFGSMYRAAINESEKLGIEIGVFPSCSKSKLKDSPRRNSFVLSIAPTGTLSMIAQCSSGIEPNFSYVYNRSTWSSGEKKTFRVIHPLFEQHLKSLYNKTQIDRITNFMYENGSIQNCPDVIDLTKKLFKTAKDIHWKDHIFTQSVAQKWIDSSISKTINLSSDTTVDDMKNALTLAHKCGLKGFTVYREGSRNDVVLETNKVVTQLNPVEKLIKGANGRILPKTPRSMMSITEKRRSNCGKLYITVAEVEGQAHTLLIKNKGGGCSAMLQTVAELSAAMLRWKIPRWELVRILTGITCDACRGRTDIDGKSCADIIGKVIKENFPDEDIPNKHDGESPKKTTVSQTAVPCPKCGKALVFAEGCRSCSECDYTRCS